MPHWKSSLFGNMQKIPLPPNYIHSTTVPVSLISVAILTTLGEQFFLFKEIRQVFWGTKVLDKRQIVETNSGIVAREFKQWHLRAQMKVAAHQREELTQEGK